VVWILHGLFGLLFSGLSSNIRYVKTGVSSGFMQCCLSQPFFDLVLVDMKIILSWHSSSVSSRLSIFYFCRRAYSYQFRYLPEQSGFTQTALAINFLKN
jgi:hypothetical protein